MASLSEKITLKHLRAARDGGPKLAMLTCYDFTMARLMQEAGVPALLVGDSAANVILGHPSTLPVSLRFMIDITEAVRRGAPLAWLVADMPFGSYHASLDQGIRNVSRMVKATQCDCVKLEATQQHLPLVKALTDAGVAVMPHLGLRPQSVSVLGGYRFQGRTAEEASAIVQLAGEFEQAGAVALLLEAVPPEVSSAVVAHVRIPVIGCGAGPECHGFVFVTHDALGLTPTRPRFVPILADLAQPMRDAFNRYVHDVARGSYPAPSHNYTMPAEEAAKLKAWMKEAQVQQSD